MVMHTLLNLCGKLPLTVNCAQSLSDKGAGSHCRPGLDSPFEDHATLLNNQSPDCWALSGCPLPVMWHQCTRLSPRPVLTCTWCGRPCLCLAATWGQVDTCSSSACSVVWSVQRQMGFWHFLISDLQYEISTDAGDPGALLAALAGHLGLRACLLSLHKFLIVHLFSHSIKGTFPEQFSAFSKGYHVTKVI